MKSFVLLKWSMAASMLISLAGVLPAADTTRITCIGNSITYGYGFSTAALRDTNAYPGLLEKALRTYYMTKWIPTLIDTVINCGVSSTTLQKHGNVPYWTSTGFPLAMASKASVVTICLGTNDSKPQNWNDSTNSSTLFPIDYQSMIDTVAHLSTNPKIFACLPPACSNNNPYGIHDSVISKYIIPRIQSVAATNDIPVIDLHTPFLKHVNYTGSQTQSSTFWYTGDGVHPLDTGHHELADMFYEAIVNSYDIVTPLERNTKFNILFLWYGYAPKATGNDTLSKPMLAWFPAAESINTHVSAIVVPGGGFSGIADTEGIPVARWLNSQGISAFVLRYRFSSSGANPAYYYPVPMMDMARAMRLIRYRAKAYKIDTTKIGVIGFSAGGLLASWLETHYDGGNAASQDSIEQKRDRPDWGFLFYPMTTMLNPYVYSPGRTYLLGSSPTIAVEDTLTNSRWVTPQTPPTFLDFGTADNIVDTQNSTEFDSALIANGVTQKLMTEPGKNHGFAMNGLWPDTAIAWLKSLGIISATGVRQGSFAWTFSIAPDFVVASSATGLQLKSLSKKPATFSIFSLSGRQFAAFSVPGNGSFNWKPATHGAFIIRMKNGEAVRMKTAVFE